MRAYALLRYGKKETQVNVALTWLSPEDAMLAAHGYGARGEWEECEPGGLVDAELVLYGEKVTWYVCPAEVMPAYSWEAARAAARFLREILSGIVKHGSSR